MTELSTAVFTLTSAGRLVTITSIITAVVPAASARNAAGADGRLNSPTAAEGAGKTGFFSNTGAVAGTFVVLGLIVAVGLVALARFFARRKRARRLDEDVRVAAGGAGDGGAGVNRFGDDEDGGNPFADEDSSAGHHQGYPTSPNMAQYAPLALSSTPGHRMSGVYVEGAAYQRPRSLGPVVGGAYEGYRDEQPLRSREYSGGSAEVGGYATDSPRHSGSGDGARTSHLPSPSGLSDFAFLDRQHSLRPTTYSAYPLSTASHAEPTRLRRLVLRRPFSQKHIHRSRPPWKRRTTRSESGDASAESQRRLVGRREGLFSSTESYERSRRLITFNKISQHTDDSVGVLIPSLFLVTISLSLDLSLHSGVFVQVSVSYFT